MVYKEDFEEPVGSSPVTSVMHSKSKATSDCCVYSGSKYLSRQRFLDTIGIHGCISAKNAATVVCSLSKSPSRHLTCSGVVVGLGGILTFVPCTRVGFRNSIVGKLIDRCDTRDSSSMETSPELKTFREVVVRSSLPDGYTHCRFLLYANVSAS
jgi:hypothetical protein